MKSPKLEKFYRITVKRELIAKGKVTGETILDEQSTTVDTYAQDESRVVYEHLNATINFVGNLLSVYGS